MANISIPNLPVAIALAGNELLEIVQNGSSLRATAAQIAGLTAGGFNPTTALVATATENIAAGGFVNLYGSGGGLLARNAQATLVARFANAFTINAVSAGNQAVFYCSGLNFAVSTVTAASQVWLSDTTAGGFITTPLDPTNPANAGKIIQPLGVASPGAGVFFNVQPFIQI